MNFKYCQVLSDIIVMRHLSLLLLFCVLFEAEAQSWTETKLSSGSKVFTIPKIHTEEESQEPPETENAVFPIENIFTVPIDDMPALPLFIMGKGENEAEILASFLLNENNDIDSEFAVLLARYYISEAEIEGINHDIAFAQMCLETGFLRFGGLVIPEMNNFCGLGAIGQEETGEWFPSVEIGVRAHIQHLKAYASKEPLKGDLVDPRYRFVRHGSSPVLHGLSGTWAADKLYAEKIEAILERLYSFNTD